MCLYLIHAQSKYHDRFRHYLGYAPDLDHRIAEHKATTWVPYEQPIVQANGKPKRGYLQGEGSIIMGLLNACNIPWEVIRIWPNSGPILEHKIKRQHHLERYCPVCAAARVAQQAGATLDSATDPQQPLQPNGAATNPPLDPLQP